MDQSLREPIVVLCPLEMERAAVQRALDRAGLGEIRAQRIGMGPDAAARAVAGLSVRPRLILLAGLCGGLAAVEALPRIARVISESGESWESPIDGGTSRAAGPPGRAASAGVTLVGVDRVICTPEDKRELHRRTGAVVVDMESHTFVRESLRRWGRWGSGGESPLRWGVVRAVSDDVDEVMPPQVARWIDAEGRLIPNRIAVDTLRRPWLIPTLIRLGRRGEAAARLVGARVVELVGAELQRHAIPAAAEASAPTPLPEELRQQVLAGRVGAVVLFGGSFDPVQLAHVRLPEQVRSVLEGRMGAPVWLLYVPAARSPFKSSPPIADAEQRAEMLRLALAGTPRASVWTDEIDRLSRGESQPSYTVHTVERARAALDSLGDAGRAVVLRLLIGSDQAAEFHRWREPSRIIALAEPMVMLRPAGPDQAGSPGTLELALRETGAWTDAGLEEWGRRVFPISAMDVSSTRVRAALAHRPREDDVLRSQLDPRVLDYIQRAGLYATCERAPAR